MVVVLLGASGSGKTAVGLALAARLGWGFLDADDLHTPVNREKMTCGIPLTDADRLPWLAAVRDAIQQNLAARHNLIVACSALKAPYRQMLQGSDGNVRLVYLKASRAVLFGRLHARKGHFFPPTLLDSQLATLEEPSNGEALTIDAEQPLAQVVDAVIAGLRL